MTQSVGARAAVNAVRPGITPTALYRVFDARNALLYVGISNSALRRAGEHGAEKNWWTDVAHIEVEWFDSRAFAEQAERTAIINERPIYNKQHNAPALIQLPAQGWLRHPLQWKCDECGQWIGARGYVQLSPGENNAWHAHCKTCDPISDSAAYWFEVKKIRTPANLTAWENHLRQKRWFDHNDWAAMLARCLVRKGKSRT